MKKILLMAALMVCVGAMAQGTVNFRTTTAMLVKNTDGSTLVGDSFYAQLYAETGGSFAPVGTPAKFLANGTLNGGVVTIPAAGVVGGQVTLQVRAWAAASAGTAGTYEAAVATRNAGISATFKMTPADPNAQPPGTPPNISGLTSFSLSGPAAIPEPSTIALGMVGAAALLLRRRK